MSGASNGIYPKNAKQDQKISHDFDGSLAPT